MFLEQHKMIGYQVKWHFEL